MTSSLPNVRPLYTHYAMRYWSSFTTVCICLCYSFVEAQRHSNEPSLSRVAAADLRFASYMRNSFHRLEGEVITSKSGASAWDCQFDCLVHPACFSFNAAANPDEKGLTLCELLSTDKFNSSDKFRENLQFHHYSLHVSLMTPIANRLSNVVQTTVLPRRFN